MITAEIMTRFPYYIPWFWLLTAAMLELSFDTQSTWHSIPPGTAHVIHFGTAVSLIAAVH